MNLLRKIQIASTMPVLALPARAKKSKVGGQAIIEGVMMRSRKKVSWAVKKHDGETAVEHFPFISATDKNKILDIPVMRGTIYLFETLKLGFRALSRSAELAYEEEQQNSGKKSFKDIVSTALSFVIAIAASVGIFMYLPILLLTWFGYEKSAFEFNVYAGSIRIGLFLLYLFLISLWKDVRRVFEYHGAEHKAIFTYEDDKELTVENMRPYKTFHPRCGTSFLILVGAICIGLFAIIDSIMLKWVIETYPAHIRLLVHLLLIPIVSGTSYEFLKLSDKYQHIPPVNFLIQPGLWLQRITTKEPDENQLVIASQALKAAL
ncbi:MAG: DUF1385 domain-containing protein [Chitinivibrionales bacterium]|nr:DUF1385 domain-containing protein [Chitinivibrionales bacterium]